MEQFFLYFLNKSLSIIWIIPLILAVRFLLRQTPKIFSYLLWGIVFIRLIFPAFIKVKMQFITASPSPYLFPTQDAALNPAAGQLQTVSEYPLFFTLAAYLWALGAAAFFAHSVISYLRLKSKLRQSRLIENNVYQADSLQTPFVFGLFTPRIYLPAGLSEKDTVFILLHETIHIKRFDHLIKPAAYIILILHWYNPFVWLAYHLLCCDMEMACDEAVLKHLGSQRKKDYALSLLSLSIEHSPKIPIGFSENNTKERVLNMMKKKKTTVGICILSAAVICVLCAVLFSSPAKSNTAQINVPTLKVREAPNESAEVIDLLPEGDTVTILGDADNGFVKIEFEDSTAYIMSEYLTFD